MKNITKTLAMVGLSACVVIGGAISGCAATPTYYSVIKAKSYQTSECKNRDDMKFVAYFTDAGNETTKYTICADCGKVNGKETLTKVDNTWTNYGEGVVYTGTLPNGQKIMTVASIANDSVQECDSVYVYVPTDVVAGYKLYQVDKSGNKTTVATYTTSDNTGIVVNLSNGAAMLLMEAE